MTIELPPKPPLRRNKVSAFLSDEDFAALRQAAESLKEDPGALAARVLAGFAADCKRAQLPSHGAAE